LKLLLLFWKIFLRYESTFPNPIFFWFTQAQIADYCFVQQSVIAQYENGKRDLPDKASEAIDEISNRLSDFEMMDLQEHASLFETEKSNEIEFWKYNLEKILKASLLVQEELNRLNEIQLQTVRVISFSEKVAEIPEKPLGVRVAWWSLQKEKQKAKFTKVSQGVKQRLVLKLHLMEEEARKSGENLRFWEGR